MASGEPVPGVLVHATVSGEPPQELTESTDSAGEFTIRGAGPWRLRLESEEWRLLAPERVHEAGRARDAPLDVWCARFVTLRGTISLEDPTAAEEGDVVVSARPADSGWPTAAEARHPTPGSAPWYLRYFPPGTVEWSAKVVDGSFEFEAPDAPRIAVVASAPRHESQRLVVDRTDPASGLLSFRLALGPTVRATVVDSEGRPVRGARLGVWSLTRVPNGTADLHDQVLLARRSGEGVGMMSSDQTGMTWIGRSKGKITDKLGMVGLAFRAGGDSYHLDVRADGFLPYTAKSTDLTAFGDLRIVLRRPERPPVRFRLVRNGVIEGAGASLSVAEYLEGPGSPAKSVAGLKAGEGGWFSSEALETGKEYLGHLRNPSVRPGSKFGALVLTGTDCEIDISGWEP
jgi:hypothetical protein